MPIFHLATAADWEAAQASGRYTTSTRGRTLAEEGFVHAARADQWQGVRERFYADVTEPMLLLVVDPARLGAPVVEEAVPDSGETFPHVYGAIDVAAVTQVIPLEPLDADAPEAPPEADPGGDGAPRRSFASLFLEEMFVNAAVGFVVIVVAAGLGLLVVAAVGDLAGLATMLVLLVAGVLVGGRFLRRRSGRQARTSAGGG